MVANGRAELVYLDVDAQLVQRINSAVHSQVRAMGPLVTFWVRNNGGLRIHFAECGFVPFSPQGDSGFEACADTRHSWKSSAARDG